MTASWYRSPRFFTLLAAIGLAVFDVYFWITSVPKPEYIAPGGWNSDTSRIDQTYAVWFAAVPVLVVLAFLGPVFRRPAQWPRRVAAILLLLAIEVAGFSILVLVGPYP